MAIAALGFSYNQIRVRSRFQFRKKFHKKFALDPTTKQNAGSRGWVAGLDFGSANLALENESFEFWGHENHVKVKSSEEEEYGTIRKHSEVL